MGWRLRGAGVAGAVAAAFAPSDPAWVERWFSRALFPAIQRLVTPVSNAVPFAVFDLLTIAAAVLLVWAVGRTVRRAWRARDWRLLVPMFGNVAAVAAVVYLVFLGVWGLNYRRVPMRDRLVTAGGPPSAEAVLRLGLTAVEQLNTLHAAAHAAGWPAAPWRDAGLVRAFAEAQRLLGSEAGTVPGRLKQSVYGPYFRWTSVDGMVNPFALEVLANPDLLPFERPFVAAHEWAHLAGYAHEAEANFLGWLTCLRGGPAARYSGWLYLYWQVSGEVGSGDRVRLSNALAEGPRRDVEAIVDRLRRGQLPLLRNASWLVYDQYLRANRVEEGIRSYGEVVTLILRTRFSDDWRPVRRDARASSR